MQSMPKRAVATVAAGAVRRDLVGDCDNGKQTFLLKAGVRLRGPPFSFSTFFECIREVQKYLYSRSRVKSAQQT